MDQVMRDVEKRGKKWTQVKQDREWEDRDRWRFLCNSRPKKWKRLKEEEEEEIMKYKENFRYIQ
jgi:hypothetical protein